MRNVPLDRLLAKQNRQVEKASVILSKAKGLCNCQLIT
jgi:hypothetical protein